MGHEQISDIWPGISMYKFQGPLWFRTEQGMRKERRQAMDLRLSFAVLPGASQISWAGLTYLPLLLYGSLQNQILNNHSLSDVVIDAINREIRKIML